MAAAANDLKLLEVYRKVIAFNDAVRASKIQAMELQAQIFFNLTRSSQHPSVREKNQIRDEIRALETASESNNNQLLKMAEDRKQLATTAKEIQKKLGVSI